MKRRCALLLMLLWILSLCACAPSTGSTYTVTRDGTDYLVDLEQHTVSDGVNIYQYVLSGTSSGYRVEITYPDGSSWHWRTQGSGGLLSGSGGGSDDYDETRYVAGETLRDVLMEEPAKHTSHRYVPLGLLFLALGVFHLAAPRTAWYFKHGWRYKNAEPSDFALGANRIGGAAALLVAVILFFV